MIAALFIFSSGILLYSGVKLFWSLEIKNKLETIISAICLYITILGSISLLLVIFKKYSLILTSLLQLIIGILIILKTPRLTIRNDLKIKPQLHTGIVLGVFVLAGILYLGYPTEYLLGGRDPGLYNIFAVYIAKTGGLNLSDPLMETLYKSFGSALRLGYPGIYSGVEYNLTENPGLLVPQFLHLFPALLANGFSLSGLKGLFYVNGIVSLISLAIIYVFTKAIWNIRIAIFTIILLFLNPAQIWSARISLTEPLAQLLLFFSLFLLYQAHIKQNKLLYIIGGIILGIGSLNRIDSLIYGPAVYIYMGYLILFDQKRVRQGMMFTAAYVIASSLGLIYGYLYSFPYFYDLWVINKSLKKLVLLNIIFFGLLLILAAANHLILQKNYLKVKKILILKRKLFLLTGIFFLLLLILSYYIRPIINTDTDINSYNYFKSFAVQQFSWYVPIPILLFSIIGLAYTLTKKNLGVNILFLVIALGTILAYLYDPNIMPDHLWASRRWVSVVIPSLLFFSSIGIERITNQKRELGSLLIVILLFFGTFNSIYYSRLFLFSSMLKGYTEQYNLLAQHIPAESIVFTTNEQLASPLKYIYLKKVFLLKDFANDKVKTEISNLIKDGKRTFFLSIDPSSIGLSFEQVLNLKLSGPYMDIVRGRYPDKVFSRDYNADLYEIQSSQLTSYKWFASDFQTIIGKAMGSKSYLSNGNEGFLVFGPYIKVEKGSYQLVIKGELIKINNNVSEIGFIDVVSNKGTKVIKKEAITPIGNLGKTTYNIEFNTEGIDDGEFRLFVNKGVILRVDDISLTKKAKFKLEAQNGN